MDLGFEREAVAARTTAIVEDHLQGEAPLLPILHDVQSEFGHIPEAALRLIAEKLNLSRAEVHGVMSFYHDFRREPAGRHVLKICRAEACQSMGGETLADGLRAALGLDWHETTADGRLTLEPVYCLGLCSCAPAAMLDDALYGRLDEATLRDVVAEAGQ
ncbi:MAG: formate dehydrogenase subunit gamma [Martelella sp.]|uniref:formate dehydrogenase subunit gamma n=2 Tax=unclassified Martelella TaxID=2629616 RepID=UPI000C48A19D|nr:formate dehydrogenase subunit gamma [Martelella sp.]MAU20349.1 formate dehydrogenase subunit gamma [Martelella sp.]